MSNHLESLNTSALHTAQLAFDQWRDTRTRRSRTPESLRIQAVSLIGEHRRAHICAALRINDQALKQWEQQANQLLDSAQLVEQPSGDAPGAKSAFVELPVHRVDTGCVVKNSRAVTAVHIDLPNGAVIRTEQLFTLEQIVSAACLSSEPGA